MPTFPNLAAIVLVLTTAIVAQAQDAKSAEHKFSLEINSTIDLTAGGKTQKIVNATDLRYAWQVNADKSRTLILEQTGSRVVIDGKTTLNAVVNRFGTAIVEGGKTLETRIEDARDEVKEMLTDSYGPPICRLTVDANGLVTKEEIVAKPGAKEQVETGIVATCTLFHGPYFADKNVMEREVSISLGNGGYAVGKLKYVRVKDFDPKKPRFTVSGTATNDKYVWKSDPKMSSRGVKYDITGEESYDPELSEWTAGTLAMKVQYKVYLEDKVASSHAGSMNFKFKLLTE